MSSNETELKLLGKKIKERREFCALTQEKLAGLCDFDPTYISLLERGKRNPPFTTLVTLSKYLKCPVSKLTDI